jgi:hypothetical protein
MNLSLAYPDRPASVTLQYFFWSHPEWWSLALCGFAWAVMLSHAWQYAGHGMHHRMTIAPETVYWMLMVAAMMLPLLIYNVRFAAFGSLWARRHRAIVGFLLGYFAPWLLLGLAAAVFRQASWMHTYAVPAIGFVVSALWQRTGIHRRALAACHRSWPLAPVGWQADRDCLRFGSFIGVACIRTCWPMMLACVFAGHGLIAMSGGLVLGIAERWSFRPPKRALLLGSLAMASYYAVLTFINS